jgi:hypothetical protein
VKVYITIVRCNINRAVAMATTVSKVYAIATYAIVRLRIKSVKTGFL